ncbi:MAG TPA: nuclear transport factor 2 family protein [Terriglobales bacterium]|nr:nuclear transport factor 2 family protein [Terriglobales bacterium]
MRGSSCGLAGVGLPVFALLLLANASPAAAQARSDAGAASARESANALQRKFFAALRDGNVDGVLSYVPEGGVNIGPSAEHASRDEIEKQLRFHHGLYCKLFDSACIQAPIELDNAQRACSYRELLTHSQKVHTAASEVTRNGVRQAVLVARIENRQCPNDKLIDFIFNLQADGWKLFSVP